MKAKPTLILATTVLWIGTLVGAYQFGQRHPAGSGGAAVTDSATGAAGDASGARNAVAGSGRDRTRGADKTMTVKQVFAQLKATMRPGAMQNPTAMMRAMSLLEKIRPEDLTEALAEAEGMKDPQSKMMIYMALIGKWAERDGPAAMKYAEEHAKDLGMAGSVMKMSAAASWAETDPDAVWAWYQKNKEGDSGGMFGGNQMVLMSIFSNLMATDPDAAFKRLDELDAGAKQMAFMGMCQSAMFDDTKRQTLLTKINAMPDGTEKTTSRQMLLSQWAVLAPSEATEWVAKQSPAEQKELRTSVGPALLMTDPKSGAAFMMAGATAEEKPERCSTSVSTWARMDPKAATQWLAEQGDGPELDPARQSLVVAISDKDPAAAMNQAKTISNPDLRLSATAAVYQTWRKKDAAAAEQALDQTGLTPEQIQGLRAVE